MLLIVLGTLGVGTAAFVIYLRRERLGLAGAGMAALRTAGLGALLLLLVNPSRLVEGHRLPPVVLLDASLSMGAAGAAWSRALDTARALAGTDGVILRFGRAVTPFDSGEPAAGASRLSEALAVAEARGGPVYVVTDGELDDWFALPPAGRMGGQVVRLVRDTVPDAALLEVAVPQHARVEDSLPVALTVGTWGALAARSGRLEIWNAGRRLLVREVDLPPPPGVARRTVTLPAGALPEGRHILEIRLIVAGDAEPRTDARARVVDVAAQPGIVVTVDPADWEGRFLVRTLAAVARAPVAGFARVAADAWLTMDDQRPVTEQTVRAAARDARVVVARGATPPPARPGAALWWWPTTGNGAQVLAGDWYIGEPLPPSPLAGRLAPFAWSELPPLDGLILLPADRGGWVGMTARQGRRGAERAALVGRDSAGVRTLVTAGQGLWRWALRGDPSLDAYRSLVAAGLDWLLASSTARGGQRLEAPTTVTRGTPVPFHWLVGAAPDSLPVSFTRPDSSFARTLRFDAGGVALVPLDTGAYRWSATAANAAGTLVVEGYSDEFPPRTVTASPGPLGGPVGGRVERSARSHWWLFALVIAALVGEWAWRQRRGLP